MFFTTEVAQGNITKHWIDMGYTSLMVNTDLKLKLQILC